MGKKSFFIIFVLIIVIVVVIIGTYFSRNFSNLLMSIGSNKIKTNYNDLVFMSAEDKQKIFTAIDSAKDPADLDRKLLFTLSDVLDLYNNKLQPDETFLIAPEFLSDNPEGVIVVYGNQKVNLLAGIEISPLKNSDMPILKSFAKLFVEEYSRYPLAWLEYITPPVIVFVKSVGVQGEVVGGVEQGVIVYNISSINDKVFSKRLIHHEIMHWVEHRSRTYYDVSWPANINDYLQKYDFKSKYNYLEHPKSGFVTGYAETNSLEDKAETYSYLFTSEGLKKLNEWSQKDDLVKNKVKYLKHFIKQRVDKMDEKYFEDYILNN